jgi:hypothetical protein
MGILVRSGDLYHFPKVQYHPNNADLLVVLMWLVTLNLNVLPGAMLMYAVPLSLLEAFLGSYLCIKISPHEKQT